MACGLGLALASAAWATLQPAPPVAPTAAVQAAARAGIQAEILSLLAMVEVSGCAFLRNGTWHDSRKAQQHLRAKYDYLAARNRIHSTEDFIEQAVTRSSLSGTAYAVRCSDGRTIPSRDWMYDALARHRAAGHP
jgi:hypothetical protein